MFGSFKNNYQEVEFFSEGLAVIRVDNKWGFVNSTGKIVVKPQFEEVRSFSEQRAAVKNRNWQWGLIDSNGIFVVKPSFAFIGNFSEGLAKFVSYVLVRYTIYYPTKKTKYLKIILTVLLRSQTPTF